MTPEAFIAKWKASELKESSAAQEHFIDLCRLLDEQTPAEADPKGDWYCFERGASKTTGGDGWADVWKRHHFGWEYKGKRKDLDTAFAQLQQYAVALENPPLLVVCDMERFRIHTNWTNTISEVHEFALDDLLDAENRQLLKWVFSEPGHLKPKLTRDALTEQVAREFAALALALRQRGHEPQTVAHFINRLVFCMFAEDVNLLPNEMFSRMLEAALHKPDQFEDMARQLFGSMMSGGMVGFEKIEWFNGGLFDSDEALELTRDEIDLVLRAARMNWSDIDPSIFGTLFERGLDPDKRSQLGAHYTDHGKIMMLVEPVVLRPLEREWADVRQKIEAEMAKAAEARARRPKTQREARKVYRIARQAEERAHRNATKARDEFVERLREFRVLDPACGSGNFLYLSLLGLKDLEHRVLLDAEALGLERPAPSVGPEVVKGIEINPYAAELARVTVWIGEIQWMKRNGFDVSRSPILKPLDNIECRDAVINDDGTEASWPEADVVVGNPPFLGSKEVVGTLGEDYAAALRLAYLGRVPGAADLVTYWFEKARRHVQTDQASRIGLVATNSIRTGASREVIQNIQKELIIFEAWADEPWVVEGAAVRVSIVCFAKRTDSVTLHPRLNGGDVSEIFSDLSGSKSQSEHDVDLTKARRLSENSSVAFVGGQKDGDFDISGDEARRMICLPLNVNGRSNSEVIRPWSNGRDISRRPSDTWIIDFNEMTESDAALYEAPFRHVQEHVKQKRTKNRDNRRRRYWWLHGRPAGKAKSALRGLSRYIATSLTSKYRIFKYLPAHQLPDNSAVVIARDDDITFGILHSRFHEHWALRLGAWLGKGNDPRYTPTTTFETFPFPADLTPNIAGADYANDARVVAIAEAASRLNELRENWLNPPDLVRREPEVVPGYPDRILPVDDKAAAILKKRTLTNLYNERPAWLDNAHRELDEAVAAAYGWSSGLDDDEILRRLFELNQERASM